MEPRTEPKSSSVAAGFCAVSAAVVISGLFVFTAYASVSIAASPVLSPLSWACAHSPDASLCQHLKEGEASRNLRASPEPQLGVITPAEVDYFAPLPSQAVEPLSTLLTPAAREELASLVEFSNRPLEHHHGDIQQFDSMGPRCGKKRRLLFVMTTGHTGTLWLSELLKCSTCTGYSNHEPPPGLGPFPYILREGREATFERRKAEKMEYFGRMVAESTGSEGMVYAETTHMFIKGWWDVIIDWLKEVDPNGERFDVDIIVLRRNISHTLRSFLTDGMYFEPSMDISTSTGGEYVLHHRHMAILPPLFPFGALDTVDEILGYLADMELQYARFRRDHPQFRYWDFRSEEIFDPAGIQRILRDLGLRPLNPECVRAMQTAVPQNEHVSWRSPALMHVPAEVFLARALLFKMRYDSLGIPFPHMPQLNEVYPCNTGPTPVAWCDRPVRHYTPAQLRNIVQNAGQIPGNLPPILPLLPLWEKSYQNAKHHFLPTPLD